MHIRHYCFLYISHGTALAENLSNLFSERWKQVIFGDQFIHSHELYVWSGRVIVGRIWCL